MGAQRPGVGRRLARRHPRLAPERRYPGAVWLQLSGPPIAASRARFWHDVRARSDCLGLCRAFRDRGQGGAAFRRRVRHSFIGSHASMDVEHMASLRTVLNTLHDEPSRSAIVESTLVNFGLFARLRERMSAARPFRTRSLPLTGTARRGGGRTSIGGLTGIPRCQAGRIATSGSGVGSELACSRLRTCVKLHPVLQPGSDGRAAPGVLRHLGPPPATTDDVRLSLESSTSAATCRPTLIRARDRESLKMYGRRCTISCVDGRPPSAA